MSSSLKPVRTILRPIVFIAIFTIATVYSFAQVPFVFTPAAEDEARLKSLAANFEKRYKEETGSLPSENKKDFLELYKLRWDDVKEKFTNKEIYTSPAAQKYLDELVAEIKKANPALQPLTFNSFFSRSGIPNASYVGEGIILFNMGLFTKLKNESQVVFVLCHEISHFYLQHSENSIRRYVTALNSTEVQKELKKIKKSEYGKREELEKLLKGLTFNSRRHGRDHESQADSMALVFMNHTRFNIAESLAALGLLDSIDAETFDAGAFVQKIFNAKDYPFQKKWLAKQEGLLGGHAKLETDSTLSDSLKTHPDCLKRVKMLEPMVKEYNSFATKNIGNSSAFDELKKTFSYEVVEYAFSSDHYSRSLFYTLQLLADNPSDPYLITQVGKVFNGFCSKQKSHTLGRVTDLPSPYYSPNYNQLLQFIQNLYLSDFSQVNYNFLKQYDELLAYYPPFKIELKTSSQFALQ